MDPPSGLAVQPESHDEPPTSPEPPAESNSESPAQKAHTELITPKPLSAETARSKGTKLLNGDAFIEVWDPLAVAASTTTTENRLQAEMEKHRRTKLILGQTSKSLEISSGQLAALTRFNSNLHRNLKDVRQENEKMKKALAAQKVILGRMEFELYKKQQEAYNLNEDFKASESALGTERKMNDQTKQQLQKKQQEALDAQKRWRDTAGQLNRFMRRGQGTNQMTDDELIAKANALRFRIKNFTLQFFQDETRLLKIPRHMSDILQPYLGISQHSTEAYMMSPFCRPMLIQAYLWQYLRLGIFSNFVWAPQNTSSSLLNLVPFLAPLVDETGGKDPAEERKFHTWRATTSAMIQDSMDREGNTGRLDRQKPCFQHTRHVSSILSLLSTLSPESMATQVWEILKECIELDEQFSKQVSLLVWMSWDEPRNAGIFDAESMELERGQALAGSEHEHMVHLVTCPGLSKLGKSDGDGFGECTSLLKPQVSCEPPPTHLVVEKAPSSGLFARFWSG